MGDSVDNTKRAAEGNRNYLTEMDVRIWLRDNDPDANTLLDDFEWTSEEVRTARTLAVDQFNETPPSMDMYTTETFPWRYNLLMGTASNLLFMAAHRYRRNFLTYNVPGGSVAENDKAPAYDAAAAKLADRYREWCRMKRNELNTYGGWMSL